MSPIDPLSMLKSGLGLVQSWGEIEVQERIRGASAIRDEVFHDVRRVSEEINRAAIAFSPWRLETVIADSPAEVQTLPQSLLAWLRRRLRFSDQTPIEEPAEGDGLELAELSVRLMRDPHALGGAIDEARPHIRVVRESIDALVPPLGPSSRSALEQVMFLEERLLVHATSAKKLGESGESPRSADALVEALMLSSLASEIRKSQAILGELLTEEVRDLTGAQPSRRMKKIRRKFQAEERRRRSTTVQILRYEADAIERALDSRA